MYRIVLVIDDQFGFHVVELVRSAYVWLVAKDEFQKVAAELISRGYRRSTGST